LTDTTTVGVPDSSRIADLELAGIYAGYNGSTVLRDVSLTVKVGRTVGLVGPNGAGKSTLLSLASGLLRPTRGAVRSGGQDITASSAEVRRRRGLSHLAEGRRVFPSLTVDEALLLVHRTLGFDRHEARAEAEQAYHRFPALNSRRRVTAALLSGGEQQMLCLAIALAGKPSVLLIDEPFMGLAPTVMAYLIDEFRHLAGSGVALVIADESRSTLERIGLDEVVSLHDISGRAAASVVS
jgi:branched-chain amino acid transport system ATP-binding protein